MSPMKAPTKVELVWEHDLVFGGRSGAAPITLDSAGAAGPSPVQALVFALAGCMGMDVVHILKKGRHDLRGLAVALVAERAPEEPHRVVGRGRPVHGDRIGARGPGAARDRPVAREVLLGLAFDAPGHPVQDSFQRGACRMTASAARRTYLDCLRGVAVLIMIEAHVIDSWTRVADRRSPAFGRSLILGGFGAPLFLFLAGVAVALSASSKARRTGDDHQAAVAVEKRGLEIFGLAFLFRLQAFVISHAPAWTLFKIDILNIMGPAIVATAWLWGAARSRRGRLVAFAASTALISFATPAVRSIPWLSVLPDVLEGYMRPIPQLTNFAVFPWAAFVPAGAFVGVLIDHAREPHIERRLMVALGLGGVALALGGYWASFYPLAIAELEVLDDLPQFLFPASRSPRRLDCGRVRLGAPPHGRPPVESFAAARPQLAVHLLDPRRDGLRDRLHAPSRWVEAEVGVDGPGGVLGLHGAVRGCQGPHRPVVEGRRVRDRRKPVAYPVRNGRGVTYGLSVELLSSGDIRSDSTLKNQVFARVSRWIELCN